MRVTQILVVLVLCCFAMPAWAQEECSEENEALLETCLADAKVACEAAYPGCSANTVSVDDALALLADKCGSCEDAKNFGKFNSCLKRVRNSIRKLGALDSEIADALKSARSECKDEQKSRKKDKRGKKDKSGDQQEDDSSVEE